MRKPKVDKAAVAQIAAFAQPGAFSTAGNAESEKGEYMSERRNVKFWTAANIRVTVINTIIVSVVAVVSAYTGNLLTQQALANRIDALEKFTSTKSAQRDIQFDKIEKKLNDDVVSNQVLQLELKPIKDTLDDQKKTLEQIKIAVIRQGKEYPPPGP